MILPLTWKPCTSNACCRVDEEKERREEEGERGGRVEGGIRKRGGREVREKGRGQREKEGW